MHSHERTLPPVLRVKEACEVAGIGRSTLYKLIGSGRVRAIKLGSRTLVDSATLLACLASLPPAPIKPPSPEAV